jgi:hypothetical protein
LVPRQDTYWLPLSVRQAGQSWRAPPGKSFWLKPQSLQNRCNWHISEKDYNP